MKYTVYLVDAMVLKEVMDLTKLKTEFLIKGDENSYLLIRGNI